MVIKSKVQCDGCRKEITRANDVNEIRMNAAHYELCPRCYEAMEELMEDIINQ